MQFFMGMGGLGLLTGSIQVWSQILDALKLQAGFPGFSGLPQQLLTPHLNHEHVLQQLSTC